MKLIINSVDHSQTLKCKYCDFEIPRWTKHPIHKADGSFEHSEAGALRRLKEHCCTNHYGVYKKLQCDIKKSLKIKIN